MRTATSKSYGPQLADIAEQNIHQADTAAANSEVSPSTLAAAQEPAIGGEVLAGTGALCDSAREQASRDANYSKSLRKVGTDALLYQASE